MDRYLVRACALPQYNFNTPQHNRDAFLDCFCLDILHHLSFWDQTVSFRRRFLTGLAAAPRCRLSHRGYSIFHTELMDEPINSAS